MSLIQDDVLDFTIGRELDPNTKEFYLLNAHSIRVSGIILDQMKDISMRAALDAKKKVIRDIAELLLRELPPDTLNAKGVAEWIDGNI